jgi:hypothetical protein
MILKLVIQEQVYPVTVPDDFVTEAEDFFTKLDSDMGKGWQMSRDWVDNPDPVQRCQIIGDKLLTAMHNDNKQMMLLLSAYILSRMPGVSAIRIDTNGEMLETELVMG